MGLYNDLHRFQALSVTQFQQGHPGTKISHATSPYPMHHGPPTLQELRQAMESDISLDDLLWSVCKVGCTQSLRAEPPQLCGLLQRAQHITDLTLAISCYPWDAPKGAQALAQTLREVGKAVGGRLQRLAILPLATSSTVTGYGLRAWVLCPEVIKVVGEQFPHLTHLVLQADIADDEATSEQWDAALSSLPQTLQGLSVTVRAGEAGMVCAAVQAAALELPQLQRLRLGCQMTAGLQGLARAAPSARAPLRHLSLRGVGGRDDVQSLASALGTPLGAGLHSLTLENTRVPGASIAELLGLVPGLRSFALGFGFLSKHDEEPNVELYQAVCSLQQLTSLQLPLRVVAEVYEQHTGCPPPPHITLPSSLGRLQLDGPAPRTHPTLLQDLLQHDWLPPHCHVVLEACVGLLTAPASDYSPSVMQHPGGVSLRFLSVDELMQEQVGMEVRGMVQAKLSALQEVGQAELPRQQEQEQSGSGQQQQQELQAFPRSVFLQCDGRTLDRSLRSTADRQPSQFMSGLKLLAVHTGKPDSILKFVSRLWADGLLPSLKHLMIRWNDHTASKDDILEGLAQGAWQAHMVALLQAGIVVQLAPRSWQPEVKEKLQEVRAAMPDPDAVLLGPQGEDSCWCC